MDRQGPLTMTDARIDPNSIVDRRPPSDWIFLEGCEAWTMAEHALAHVGRGPCPICKSNPKNRRGARYCSGCDKTGLDGKVSFPGLRPGQVMNEEWLEEYPEEGTHHTAYRPQEGLKGGVGARDVKFRRGVVRSRKVG